MLDVMTQIGTISFLNKAQLVKLRLKAMRSGAWFKALRKIDRALIDLTIKVARHNVRSIVLAKNILAIIEKLEGHLETGLSRVMREVGLPLAKKVSALAQKWGNSSAKGWSSEPAFIRFLAVSRINEPAAFRLRPICSATIHYDSNKTLGGLFGKRR
jgi:hypothetical protein